MINHTSIIQQNTERFLANHLSGEMVFMNLDNGSYLGLNAVGTAIWNFTAQPARVEEIVARLMAQYNVDQETCEQQTIELLVHMQNEQMIIVS